MFPNQNTRSAPKHSRTLHTNQPETASAAVAVREIAKQTPEPTVSTFDRLAMTCIARPTPENRAAFSAAARRAAELAMRLYNDEKPIPAEIAANLAEITSGRYAGLDEVPAADVFQRGLARNSAQLIGQVSALQLAARREGFLPG